MDSTAKVDNPHPVVLSLRSTHPALAPPGSKPPSPDVRCAGGRIVREDEPSTTATHPLEGGRRDGFLRPFNSPRGPAVKQSRPESPFEANCRGARYPSLTRPNKPDAESLEPQGHPAAPRAAPPLPPTKGRREKEDTLVSRRENPRERKWFAVKPDILQ